jgi:ribosomal-protein-alanine N-acetyltransferase
LFAARDQSYFWRGGCLSGGHILCDAVIYGSSAPSVHLRFTIFLLTLIFLITTTRFFTAVKMVFSTPPMGPWTSARAPRYSLHPVPIPLFEALKAEDLGLASSIAPPSLPPLPSFLISEANRGIWGRRLALVAADPEQTPWISRVVIYKPELDQEEESSNLEKSKVAIVGRIGFHGKPDERGMVEVGYEIDPEQRGKGHVKAAMKIMVDVARGTQGVNVLKASVAPENWISRRVVEGEGLRKVGREVHERRGLEEIFEIDVSN